MGRETNRNLRNRRRKQKIRKKLRQQGKPPRSGRQNIEVHRGGK